MGRAGIDVKIDLASYCCLDPGFHIESAAGTLTKSFQQNPSLLGQACVESVKRYYELAASCLPEGDRCSLVPFSSILFHLLCGGVVLGVLFLLSNLGFMEWRRWDMFWPVVIIAIGATLLFRRAGRN